eukprot:6591332-Pyramimonas_sp.AAC.1
MDALDSCDDATRSGATLSGEILSPTAMAPVPTETLSPTAMAPVPTETLSPTAMAPTEAQMPTAMPALSPSNSARSSVPGAMMMLATVGLLMLGALQVAEN